MPLTRENRLGQNWFIEGRVSQALTDHLQEGVLTDRNYIYIGASKRIGDIVQEFANSAESEDVASSRITVKLSCQDRAVKKYHIVAIYQTERDMNNEELRVLEATWTPKGRTPLPEVIEEINRSFADLIERSEKYGQKPAKIVGILHLYQRGQEILPRLVK